MTKILNFPKGSIIMFTSGEYSDYGVNEVLIAVQDLDLPNLVSLHKKEHRRSMKHAWDKPGPDTFVAWLIATERATPIAYQEVHLGSYRELTLGG